MSLGFATSFVKIKKLIQIKNLSKKYGDANALNQLGLAIPRNEIFGLLGPNGAGKSTLIKIILGLVKLTQGSILFNEKNLFHHRTEFVNQIGCLMETPAFHTHLTGRENLNYLNLISESDDRTLGHVLNKMIDAFRDRGCFSAEQIR